MKRLLRKPLSIVLAAVLLLTTVLSALPLMAAAETKTFASDITVGPFLETVKENTSTTVLEATPIEYNSYSNWNLSLTQTEVTPLGYTTAKGILHTVSDSFVFTDKAFSWDNCSFIEMNSALGEGTTHLMVYLKTDGAVALMPLVNAGNDRKFAESATVQYLPINGTEWLVKQVEKVGSTNYGIRFSESFEGYVKIAIADLVDETNSSLTATTEIGKLFFGVEGMGGDYANNMVVGPYFTISANNDATDIKVPAEWSSSAVPTAPVKGNIIETKGANSSSMTNATVEADTPVEDIESNGYNIKVKTPFDLSAETDPSKVAGWGAAGSMLHIFANPYTLDSSATDITMYVKVDGETTVSPSILAEYTYYLSNGKGVKLLAEGSSTWKSATIGSLGTDTGYYGVEFTEAFEGYIKIPLTNMVRQDDGLSMAGIMETGALTISDLYVQIEAMGVVEIEEEEEEGTIVYVDYATEITVAPYFEITSSNANGSVIAFATGNSGSMTSCTIEQVFPISGQSEPGYKLTNNTPYDNSEERNAGDIIGWGSSKSLFHMYRNEGDAWSMSENATDLCFYVSVNGPTTLSPAFFANGVMWYMMDGTTKVKLRAEGSSSWTDATVSDYGIETGYYGVEFTEAFTGYVKIPFSGIICSDNGKNLREQRDTGFVTSENIYMQVESMGRVAKIEKPKEVTPWGSAICTSSANGASATNTSVSEVNPLTETKESGYKLTVNTPFDKSGETDYTKVVGWGAADSMLHIIMSEYKLGVETSNITFYVETNGPTTISPSFMSGDYNFYITGKAKAKLMNYGESEWKDAKVAELGTGTGYYGIELTEAFKGFITIPYRGLARLEYDKQLLSTRHDANMGAKLSNIYVQFEQLGGSNATEVTVGPFFEWDDPNKEGPYQVQNVWDKKDLPEMVPFTDVSKQTWYWEMANEVIPSPIPTLSTSKAMYHQPTTLVDVTGQDTHTTDFHSVQTFNDMPVGNFTHLMFYIEVPEAKDNSLSIYMFTEEPYVGDSKDYQMSANALYALLPVGSTTWEHYYAEDVQRYSAGSIIFPAGFKGFLKIPMESLLPNTVDAETQIRHIYYRFGYAGMDDDKVLIGPVFGVTKDNDPGPGEVILSALPVATTIRRVYQVEDGDIYPEKVMLYWQSLESAKYYKIEAYEVMKAEKGYEYKLVSTTVCHTNSGTVIGLTPGTSYAFVVKGYSADNKIVGTYEYVKVKTLEAGPYAEKEMFANMNLDTVLYPAGSVGVGVEDGGVNWLLIGIIAGAALLLGGAAAVTIVLVNKKRRKTNA